MKVAASPQSINRAMPEGGIQVTSHQSLVTPNPQSLIPSYSSLLSNLWWQLRCKIYICGEAAATISNFSFLIQTRLSNGIKGRPAPMATPD